MSVENFDVKIMTKGILLMTFKNLAIIMFIPFNISQTWIFFSAGTKKNVTYGEIKFTTVSDAIEAVMCINYAVFQSKSMYKY